ncbi:MAG: glycosyltransferase family 39 protein [Acidobacteriota bacterium]|nr:glycosyltransferase family 39 protein [Acidobacteriota bacterium]
MLARARSFFNPDNPTQLPRRLFWTAFLIRVAYIALAHTFRIRPADDHFQFAWEAGRIARALVTGNGYADAFANTTFPHTGPTAWLPPLYPLLIAAIFRIFGVYSHTSAFVLFTLQSAFSAATALATYEIAARCFNRRVALWSAWIWAFHPAAMQYAVRWPWEMSLTTALFTFTLVLALRMRGVGDETSRTSNLEPQTSQWLLFGLLCGLIALSNSTLLIFLPICGLWILLGKKTGAPTIPGAPSKLRLGGILQQAASALVFLACIAPWTFRNQQAFHTFIPLRGNLGAELYMGNGPSSNGLLMEYFHPFQAPEQLRLYATMGEVRYVAMRSAAAKQFIAAHPAHYASNIALRIYFFWISVPQADVAPAVEAARVLNFAFTSIAGLLGLALALRHRVPAAGLFAWAILLLPIPYYAITVAARFRHPLEPLLCILAVYLFQSAQRSRT